MLKSRRVQTLLLAGVSLLAVSAAHAQSDTASTSNVGQVDVQGAGTELGSGYMVQETAPKGRSTVTNAGIQNLLPTSNPFQDMNVLPGVSQQSLDATGLFGGQITVRGLRADELGFTINGAPVNDSGNYAIYPQEYLDTENLDQIFVTQGSTDVDSPHVGASGGNIGIVSSRPLDYFNVRAEETAGQLSLLRHFVRLDTGFIGPVKAFISYSHADVDKWRGLGGADRDHIDAQIYWQVAPGSSVSLNVLYNNAVSNFFRQVSKADIAANGWKYDYNKTLTGDPYDDSNYWALQINPFKNAVVNFDVNLQLTDNLRFEFAPYYWYGWGGGGFGRAVTEGTTTFRNGNGQAFGDLNGDGDTNDTVLTYRSSVTRTKRPGFNTKLTYDFSPNWTFQIGGWYEHANHRQTQPYSYVNTNGKPCDQWLTDTSTSLCVLRDASGHVIQGRDQLTISTGSAIFGNVSGSFLNDALKVNVGLSYRTLDRDGKALLRGLPVLTPGSGYYDPFAVHPHFSYHEPLPTASISYDVTDEHQVFADVARNFKAPANYVMFTYNGDGTELLSGNFKAETSWAYEAGYRYHGSLINGSITGFYTDLKNYQATAELDDPFTFTSVNIGGVHVMGVEAEVGTAPWHGLTAYASLTYQGSELQDDYAPSIVGGVVQHLPTSGKDLPDTPNLLFGASLGYENSGFFASISPKYTGTRKSTLMNDEGIPAFWTVDASVGYSFDANMGALHNTRLQLFVSNLFDKKYLGELNSTGYGNAQDQTSVEGNTIFGSTVRYSPGAPRFIGVRLTADMH